MNIWQHYPKDGALAELSLWSADLANLEAELKRTDKYADLYHLDVADGHFSPQLLFFPDQVARLRQLTNKLFHVHLMIERRILLDQIDQFVEAGAGIITIWLEHAAILDRALDKISAAKIGAGISLKLDEPVDSIIPYLDRIQLVTMMGTAIGVKGQDLSENACSRMAAMRTLIRKSAHGDRIRIAADGGNRRHTVPLLRASGADTIVMGSLAYASKDISETFKWLWGLQIDQ